MIQMLKSHSQFYFSMLLGISKYAAVAVAMCYYGEFDLNSYNIPLKKQ